MPKPKYVVCCESILHDKTSNLVSLFNVLEGYTVQKQQIALPAPQEGQALVIPVAIMQLVGVAVWELSSEAEGGGEFDFELALHLPGLDSPSLTSGTFKFNKKRHYRFLTRMEIAPNPKIVSGDIRFTSKVKPVGTNRWKSQEYAFPITIESKELTKEDADHPAVTEATLQ
jgi:hypothetical protein